MSLNESVYNPLFIVALDSFIIVLFRLEKNANTYKQFVASANQAK